MNCGVCGKPIFDGGQICEGCRKALVRNKGREFRRFERQSKYEEKFKKLDTDDEEDATEVWIDKLDDEYKRQSKRYKRL